MTAIVVVGPHRSGTSAVAGILYHLGVPMGDDLIGPGHGNPTGHFEDRDFVRLHDVIIGDWKNPKVNFEPYRDIYTMLIRERESRLDLWGIKDPRMCFVFPYFAEIAQDIRVISVSRDLDARIESLFVRGGHTRKEARKISSRYSGRWWSAMSEFTGPILKVWYDRLIDCPEKVIPEIADFVGLDVMQEAIDFIDPSLCHWR